MKRSVISYLLCAVMLFASCKKGSKSDTDQSQSIVGMWKWVMQTDAIPVNGTPYDTLTPKNTGITKLLNIKMDGSWALLENNQIANSGTYTFAKELSPDGILIVLDFVDRSGKDSLVNHWISNDSLYISNTLYIDRYTINVYAR